MAGMIQTGGKYVGHPRRKRPGVHAKTKSSKHKGSRNYLKVSRGQGK